MKNRIAAVAIAASCLLGASAMAAQPAHAQDVRDEIIVPLVADAAPHADAYAAAAALRNPYKGTNGKNGGWTPRAAWLRDTIKARFGLKCTTYVTSDRSSEHYTGNALDCWGPLDKRRQMASWAASNAAALEVYYVIHEQKIWSLPRRSEGWRKMPDRGDKTANHYDHVHISMQHPGHEY